MVAKTRQGRSGGARFVISPSRAGSATFRAVAAPFHGARRFATRARHVLILPTDDKDTTAPASPGGLTATAGDTTVDLSWDPVTATDLAGYLVYRSTSPSGPWTQLTPDPVTDPTYRATGLTNATTYHFTVTATDTSGNESPKSEPAHATPTPPEDTTAPASPGGLTATAGDTTVDLSWDPVTATDLAGYLVYRSTSPSGPWTQLTPDPVTDPTYRATGLTNATTYHFTVTATDTSGNESPKSEPAHATPTPPEDTTAPASPGGLTATAGDTTVDLSWDPVTATDLAGYLVYRSTSPSGPWTQLTPDPVTDPTYRATGLTNATTYHFTVTATDTSGNESPKSEPAHATPTPPEDTTAPASPGGLTATAGDTTVDLSWDPVTATDLAGYLVYRSTSPSGPWTQLTPDPVTDPTYRATGLTNATTYHFTVTATDTSGNESPKSEPAHATPTPPEDTTAPASPGGLTATAGDTTVDLSWDPVTATDLAGYLVYRSTSPSGPWTQLTPDPVTDPTYRATGLTNATTYHFTVTATDTSGNESPKSEPAHATPTPPEDTTAPASPGGLTATAGDTTVDLSWDPVTATDLAGYLVYRSTSPSGPWTQLTPDPVTDPTYRATGLTNATTYHFTVTATDTSGNESPKSEPAHATPTPPSVVKHCGALAHDESWDATALHRVTCDVRVPPGVRLEIGPGAIVKFDANVGLVVDGNLVVAGSPQAMTTLTSIADDEHGGDTNGDGSSSAAVAQGWTGISVSGDGTFGISSASITYATAIISKGSLARMVSTAITKDGRVRLDGCADGVIAGNTFKGTSLVLSGGCSIPVHDNRFLNTPDPLTVVAHDNLALVDLAGDHTNTFTGTGSERHVTLDESRVRPGSELVVDPAAGLVLEPDHNVVEGTTTLMSGLVVKTDATTMSRGGGFSVSAGGLLDLAGTVQNPIVVTSLKDDAVAGDTAGDGTSDPSQSSHYSGLATINGGSLRVAHAEFRWLESPLSADYEAPAEVTIRDSAFTIPGHLSGDSGSGVSRVHLGRCADGVIAGNTFKGTSLVLSGGCSIPVHDNRFLNTPDPLTVVAHDNLALVDLAGDHTNTFTGTGSERHVTLDESRVRPGSELVVDPAAGLVLEPDHNVVEGTTTLMSGLVVKTDATTMSRGGGFSVSAGGLLDLAGTVQNPIVVTSLKDDAVAGDTAGDGTSDPSQSSHYSGLATINGGSLRVAHAEFRWLESPLSADYEAPAEVTIRDSAFTIPGHLSGDSGSGVSRVHLGRCADGVIAGNTFKGTSLVLSGGCSIPVHDNRFLNTPDPLTVVAHDNLALVDLAGDHTNTFTGTGSERHVTLDESRIADGDELVVSGTDSHAVLEAKTPITSSHAIDQSRTGSVSLLPGTVVKGDGYLFDLGPRSEFTAAGTPSAPVVFTTSRDDAVAGDTNGDGTSEDTGRFDGVFKVDQGAAWPFALGAVGLDLRQVGPGHSAVTDAVVKHAETGFAGCLVCDLSVNSTDFVDVVTGATQAFYEMPVAPCTALMGSGVLDGGSPAWQPADVAGNYWGGPLGPSTDVNLAEIALAFANQKEQYDKLVVGLPLEDYNVVSDAYDGMIAQLGGDVPNFNLSGQAAVGVSVQSCTIPVINLTFPVVRIPENFLPWSSSRIHSDALLLQM